MMPVVMFPSKTRLCLVVNSTVDGVGMHGDQTAIDDESRGSGLMLSESKLS